MSEVDLETFIKRHVSGSNTCSKALTNVLLRTVGGILTGNVGIERYTLFSNSGSSSDICHIVLSHCTVTLYCHTVLSHWTVTLYCHIVCSCM